MKLIEETSQHVKKISQCEAKCECELRQKHKANVKREANKTCVKCKVNPRCACTPPREAKLSLEFKLLQKHQGSIKREAVKFEVAFQPRVKVLKCEASCQLLVK